MCRREEETQIKQPAQVAAAASTGKTKNETDYGQFFDLRIIPFAIITSVFSFTNLEKYQNH